MMKKLFKILSLLILLPLLLVACCHLVIELSTGGRTYTDVDNIPPNRVGIILGTSRQLTTGADNPFYTHRIAATLDLYRAGKIQYVLVSGDNGSQYYNEPTTIRKDLVAGGIPESRIFLDYAGFRTLDSMVRAKFIFGLDSATVISQEFHNERAIFLAAHKGLDAIGFNAADVDAGQGMKVYFREYLARVKVFVDLLLNTQPRFYGEQVQIE